MPMIMKEEPNFEQNVDEYEYDAKERKGWEGVGEIHCRRICFECSSCREDSKKQHATSQRQKTDGFFRRHPDSSVRREPVMDARFCGANKKLVIRARCGSTNYLTIQQCPPWRGPTGHRERSTLLPPLPLLPQLKQKQQQQQQQQHRRQLLVTSPLRVRGSHNRRRLLLLLLLLLLHLIFLLIASPAQQLRLFPTSSTVVTSCCPHHRYCRPPRPSPPRR